MAEEDDDNDDTVPEVGAPPEADTVALRAFSVASLLRRLELENRGAPKEEYAALSKWVEDNGLFSSFGPSGIELFDAAPGSWSTEEKQSVAWAAEELQLLLWAMNKAEAPPLFARVAAAPLLASLPDAGDVEPISLAAALRPAQAIDTLRSIWEPLANAARLEAWARSVAEDVSLTADDELEQLLTAMAESGFERERITKEQGPQAAATQALRAIARGLIGDVKAFDPQKLETLDDDALGLFLACAQLRAEALSWLTEGDDWDEEDD